MFSENFTLLNSFTAHTTIVNDIVQSPFNSDYVATVSDDTTAKIWNVSLASTWPLVRTYSSHTSWLLAVKFLSEDEVITGSNDQSIKIWSIKTGQTSRTITTGSPVISLQLMNNGYYLAAGLGYPTRNINIYDLNTGFQIGSLSGHTNDVNDLVLINSYLLASSSADFKIRIWDLTTNATKFILAEHTNTVNGLKLVSSDILASGSQDATVKFWNVTSGSLIRTFTGHTANIMLSVDLLYAEQTQLISGSHDQTIKLWNISTGECLKTVATGMQIRALVVLSSATSVSSLTTTSKIVSLLIHHFPDLTQILICLWVSGCITHELIH